MDTERQRQPAGIQRYLKPKKLQTETCAQEACPAANCNSALGTSRLSIASAALLWVKTPDQLRCPLWVISGPRAFGPALQRTTSNQTAESAKVVGMFHRAILKR
jgi:hypothetical protein